MRENEFGAVFTTRARLAVYMMSNNNVLGQIMGSSLPLTLGDFMQESKADLTPYIISLFDDRVI